MLKRKIGPYCERLPGRFLPVLGSGATSEKLNSRDAGLPKMSIFTLTRSLCWSTEVIVPVKFWNGPALICTLPPGEYSSSRLIMFSSFRICLSFAPHVSDGQAQKSEVRQIAEDRLEPSVLRENLADSSFRKLIGVEGQHRDVL